MNNTKHKTICNNKLKTNGRHKRIKACGGKKCGSAFEWNVSDIVKDIRMAA